MNTINNRTARQSQKSFADALLITMRQYDYQEITISQISQEAGLSRKTFYKFYHTKQDVLNEIFKCMVQEFTLDLKTRQIHNYWELVAAFFDYYKTQKDLLLLLQKNHLLFMLYETSYHYASDIFLQYHPEVSLADGNQDYEFMFAYSIGGMYSMLLKWVDTGMTIPPRQFIKYLKNNFVASMSFN